MKLIEVEKEGETLKVHPDTLANHLENGWAEKAQEIEPELKEEPKTEKVIQHGAKTK